MKKALLLFMTLATFVLSAQNIDSNKRGNWEKSKTDYTPLKINDLGFEFKPFSASQSEAVIYKNGIK